ncbi:MAG: helicase-related protein [Bacillota bacterium]
MHLLRFTKWSPSGALDYSTHCDLAAWDADTNQLLAVSFTGHDSAVRGLVAVLRSKERNGLHLETGEGESYFREWFKPVDDGYRVFYGQAGDGLVHAVVISDEAFDHALGRGLAIAWDGDGAAAFGQLLAKRYTVPFLPEWVPWILREARDQGWVTDAEVYKADPANPVAVVTVTLTEEDLANLVTEGVKTKKLKFPPEDAPDQASEAGLSEATDVTSYLKTFAQTLGTMLTTRFKPRHEMGAGHEVFRDLLRKPFPAQADVILGLAETLRVQRNAVVVGEMGTGKTLMGAVVPYVLHRDRYRVLVMCPGHLVKKWAREISITVPGAVVRLIDGWEDALKLKDEPLRPVGRDYWVISRDRAKLGYSVKPAAVWSRRRKSLTCPDCGEPLVDKDGVALGPAFFATPRAANWKCSKCGSVLWQADHLKVRRYAPAEFMKRYLHPGFFDLFVGDEVHELKGDSAQGNAFGALASVAKGTLAMTGTLLGGYASDLFRILYRLDPKALVGEGIEYGRSWDFVLRYGTVEKVFKEGDSERNRTSRGRKTRVAARERPGVSPLIFSRHLLGQTAFIELSDLGLALPPYTEQVELVGMDDELAKAHGKLRNTLVKAVREEMQKGSSKLLGAYLINLLAYPDHPYQNPPITHPDTGDLVAVPEELSSDRIYPKEERLLRIVKEQRARGRRVMVYATFTGARDMTKRLSDLLSKAGCRVAVLHQNVAPVDREEWLADQVRRGVDVVVCNPKLVETGLDLIDFPTIVFYQTGYSLFTLRQASRRSWRPGQTKPVEVRFLAYDDTLQETALRLMGSKLEAALTIEGKFSEEGLRALAAGDNITSELAKALVKGLNNVESAEWLWKKMYQNRPVTAEEESPRAEIVTVKPSGEIEVITLAEIWGASRPRKTRKVQDNPDQLVLAFFAAAGNQ